MFQAVVRPMSDNVKLTLVAVVPLLVLGVVLCLIFGPVMSHPPGDMPHGLGSARWVL